VWSIFVQCVDLIWGQFGDNVWVYEGTMYGSMRGQCMGQSASLWVQYLVNGGQCGVTVGSMCGQW